jgi:hypothetical protein
MKRLFLLIVLSVFISSCNTAHWVIGRFPIANHSTVSFNNYSIRDNGKISQSINILDLFEVYQEGVENVEISIADKDLTLKAVNNKGKAFVFKFKGKYISTDEFEVYFRNERLEIPPILPVLMSRYDIYRLRISITRKGKLRITERFSNSGTILIIGAGGGWNHYHYFLPTTK